MTTEDVQKSMEEFYNFIYSENVRDFETSKEYKILIEQMKEALELMSEKTNSFSDISLAMYPSLQIFISFSEK